MRRCITRHFRFLAPGQDIKKSGINPSSTAMAAVDPNAIAGIKPLWFLSITFVDDWLAAHAFGVHCRQVAFPGTDALGSRSLGVNTGNQTLIANVHHARAAFHGLLRYCAIARLVWMLV